MTFVSAGDVCHLLSANGLPVPYRTLAEWCDRGAIKPAGDTTGTGVFRRFALVPDVLAISVSRLVKGKGGSLELAGAVFDFLARFDEESLLKEFRASRTCLLVVGNAVAPRLFSRNAVAASIRDNTPIIKSVAGKLPGMLPHGVDVQAAYRALVDELERLEAERRPEAVA